MSIGNTKSVVIIPSVAVPAESSGDIQFNNNGTFGGSLATITASGSINHPILTVDSFNNDTGISRYQQNVLAVGNGTQADYTGTVLTTDINATGSISASGTSFKVQPGTPANNGYAGGLGYSFSVTQQITVTRLGRKYQGTGNNQNIYIWIQGNATALVTATILSASSADGNGFKWVNITALTLTPGNYYYITADFQASDVYLTNFTPTLQSQFQLVTPVTAAAATNPNVPGAVANAGQIWDTPAMTYTYDTGIVNTSQYQLNSSALTVGMLPGQPSLAQLYGTAILVNPPIGSTQTVGSTLSPTNLIVTANAEVQGWLWPQGILYDNIPSAGINGHPLLTTGTKIVWDTAGVTAGPFTALTSIQSAAGIVTGLSGTSDKRLKDGEDYTDGLKVILNLHPKRYRWNAKGHKQTGLPTDKDYIGLFAQDVLEVMPEAISTEKSKTKGDDVAEYYCLDDKGIVAALINAVQEQQIMITKLQESGIKNLYTRFVRAFKSILRKTQ